jgi:hypothetical protein
VRAGAHFPTDVIAGSIAGGKKFEHYRSTPSLKEYVLVSFREPLVESHMRNADGSWNTSFAGARETLALRSIDGRLDVEVDAVQGELRRPRLLPGMCHDGCAVH